MISFRTIATMAKWDCQTIAATTEREGGEQSSAPVCHLREGRDSGGKAADTNGVKSLCKKGRTGYSYRRCHSNILTGCGEDDNATMQQEGMEAIQQAWGGVWPTCDWVSALGNSSQKN